MNVAQHNTNLTCKWCQRLPLEAESKTPHLTFEEWTWFVLVVEGDDCCQSTITWVTQMKWRGSQRQETKSAPSSGISHEEQNAFFFLQLFNSRHGFRLYFNHLSVNWTPAVIQIIVSCICSSFMYTIHSFGYNWISFIVKWAFIFLLLLLYLLYCYHDLYHIIVGLILIRTDSSG